MAVREPMTMRRAALAGAVALALTGTGAALAWSATGGPTPSPSPSQSSPSAPGNSGNAPGHNKPDKQDRKAQRPQPLHGEGVVKNPDGSFQTVVEQRGTVEAVTDTAITVKSEDGYSRTYTVNGDTRIISIPAPAAEGTGDTGGSGAAGDDGRRLKPTEGTITDIAAGDTVRIAGVKDGDTATAKRIVKGAGDGPGLGLGRGHGHGKGHNM